MHNVIETIELGFGLPVNSRIAAIQEYNERARNGAFANYGNVLRGILGIDCQELENPDHARVQVGYAIDLSVGRHVLGEEIDPNTIYVEATAKARDFARECGWAFAKKEEEVRLDCEGKPKPKKGTKGQRAYAVYCEIFSKVADKVTEPDADTRAEIIAAFQDREVMGMEPFTKAGATTYFYNMKRKYEKQHG